MSAMFLFSRRHFRPSGFPATATNTDHSGRSFALGERWHLLVCHRLACSSNISHCNEGRNHNILTVFMGQSPQTTDSNFKKLAKRYKEKADGDKTFPKLPSMVKSYYTRWKKNQDIKLSRYNVGPRRRLNFEKNSSARAHLQMNSTAPEFSRRTRNQIPRHQ